MRCTNLGADQLARGSPARRPRPRAAPRREQPLRTIELRQHADRLVAWPVPAGTADGSSPRQARRPGSPIGLIRTRNGLIRIERLDDFWDGGVPPGWASGWGRDELGAWVAFRVGEATQRLRWIPPGRFLMGSPEDEAGRYSDEGPRHEETIEPGFWMFDTPCTQALWQEVMGNEPEPFPGSGSSRRACELGGLPGVHPAPERAAGRSWPRPSVGSAMGVCLPRGDGDAAVSRGPGRDRLVLGEQSEADAARRPQGPERLGPVRHAGERVGVVRGCLASGLHPPLGGGRGRAGVCPPRRPGRLLELRPAGRAGGVPGPRRADGSGTTTWAFAVPSSGLPGPRAAARTRSEPGAGRSQVRSTEKATTANRRAKRPGCGRGSAPRNRIP